MYLGCTTARQLQKASGKTGETVNLLQVSNLVLECEHPFQQRDVFDQLKWSQFTGSEWSHDCPTAQVFLSSAPSRTSPAPRTPCPLWSFREADGMGRIIAGGSPRILSRLYPWLYESNNTENIGFDKKNKKQKKKQNQSKQKKKQTRKPKPRKKTRKNKKSKTNCGKCRFCFFLFFVLVFFVSSGVFSCRFVFWVILFFFAKIFLCSTRGHNPGFVRGISRINRLITRVN